MPLLTETPFIALPKYLVKPHSVCASYTISKSLRYEDFSPSHSNQGISHLSEFSLLIFYFFFLSQGV